jgi:hypothetical protein
MANNDDDFYAAIIAKLPEHVRSGYLVHGKVVNLDYRQRIDVQAEKLARLGPQSIASTMTIFGLFRLMRMCVGRSRQPRRIVRGPRDAQDFRLPISIFENRIPAAGRSSNIRTTVTVGPIWSNQDISIAVNAIESYGTLMSEFTLDGDATDLV